MTRLARCFPLQHANSATVRADHALQLVHIAIFDEVVEDLQDAAGTGIKRGVVPQNAKADSIWLVTEQLG
jgi:hypothetical protein